MRFVRLRGAAAASLRNVDQLFDGGLCSTCGAPQGPRTTVPAEFVYEHGRELSYHGASAVNQDEYYRADRRPFVLAVSLYSRDFVDGIESEQAGILQWRPAVVHGKARHEMWELAGSTRHLPLARLRDDRLMLYSCPHCGWQQEPSYAATSALPLAVIEAVAGKPQMRARDYVRTTDLEGPAPALFTAGQWYLSADPVVPDATWARLEKNRKTRFTSGVLSEVLESAGGDMLVPIGAAVHDTGRAT